MTLSFIAHYKAFNCPNVSDEESEYIILLTVSTQTLLMGDWSLFKWQGCDWSGVAGIGWGVLPLFDVEAEMHE